jgi:Interferon-related developmental regulator (IFRD)
VTLHHSLSRGSIYIHIDLKREIQLGHTTQSIKMHDDLRRRALESGKTVSKKAKSKESSRNSSRPNSKPASRGASRVASRDVSDDEDAGGNLSDDTNHSINSIDALLESDDFNDQTTDMVKQQLTDCIADFLDRKSSNNKSREENLQTYVACLTSHLLADVLYGRVSRLRPRRKRRLSRFAPLL